MDPDSRPVWHDASPLPARCGTLIVGGGITGAALLHWLTGDAILVERAPRLAFGASGRNAGFLMAGIASNHAEAVERYGRSLAVEIYAFTLETHRLLAEELKGRAEHVRRGSWRIARSGQEAIELEQSETLLREDGFEVRYSDGRLLTPADGEHNPARTVAAIAGPYLDSVRLGIAVERLDAAGDGVRVHWSGGECIAETVILATNAYTPQLLPAAPISPVRGQMLASAPVPRAVVDRPSSADRGFQYWRQRQDGRVLVGGYRNLAPEAEVGYDERPTEQLQSALEKHLRALGVEEPVTHRWAGTMGFTADELPLVGAIPGHPGVYVCGGYTGHGWAFAFQVAKLLVEHLRGGPAPPAWMDPARF